MSRANRCCAGRRISAWTRRCKLSGRDGVYRGTGVAVNAPSRSLGATWSRFKSAAATTSCGNPQPISSLPETQRCRASSRRGAASSYAAIAAVASGERLPFRCARTAPAPIWSSNDGRRLLSRQRSPQAMTATRGPHAIAANATARALRRHPAKVGVLPVPSERVAPFGDGSTMRLPLDRVIRECGESECPPEARGPASTARTDLA